MKQRRTTSEATGQSSLFKQRDGNSKSFWIPAEEKKQNLEDLLIQIETAARAAFQNERISSGRESNNDKNVFVEIANHLIGQSAVSDSGRGSNLQNDNANPAQADTKG